MKNFPEKENFQGRKNKIISQKENYEENIKEHIR